MKIVFISNFLTHHQLPFCLEMVEKYGDDYKFISTIKITEERLKLGWKDMDNDYDFVVKAYESQEKYEQAINLANTSDIVIMGSTSDEYIKQRLEDDKLIFRYRERIFQNGYETFIDSDKMKLIYERHIKYRNNKNLYMLCASGYGACDFYRLGLYRDRIYKWGYFPKFNTYDVDELLKARKRKDYIQILWTGRFKSWKHPEYMVEVAKRLKKLNVNFKIKMLGNGEDFENIKNQIKENRLNENVELLGSVESDKVIEYMKESDIYAFTSGREEGWGAVLNESMNSCLAVVANKNAGAVPFLINDGENGYTYETLEEFCTKIEKLVLDEKLRIEFSKNAYDTIAKTWNSKVATQNLISMLENRLEGKDTPIEFGPASKAFPISEVF